MKASNLVKTLIATSLLSGAFIAGGASAAPGCFTPMFGGYDDSRTQYRNPDWDRVPDFRRHNDRDAYFVDRAQTQQRERIFQGIRSGELTPFEANRLMAEQRDIQRQKYQYLADGRLTPFERQRLKAELDQASQDIWREKHDAEDRDDFRRPWQGYR